MEDFFQLVGYITATFIIGFYIKRLRTINYNLKKKIIMKSMMMKKKMIMKLK